MIERDKELAVQNHSSQENQNMHEICARCGKETEYDINIPLEARRWYVEGSGQLCEDCWYKLWPRREYDAEVTGVRE